MIIPVTMETSQRSAELFSLLVTDLKVSLYITSSVICQVHPGSDTYI